MLTCKNNVYEWAAGPEDERFTLYFYQNEFVNGRNMMVMYTEIDEATGEAGALDIYILTENGDGTAAGTVYRQEL